MDLATKRGRLDEQPTCAPKKVKTDHLDFQSDEESSHQDVSEHTNGVDPPDTALIVQMPGDDPTVESSLPPADPSQALMSEGRWSKGRSSIYVDAFNLALDTVLEDESHLFDNRERTVFDKWKSLGYEAQYLYVRLFLRKTAAWHRTSNIGYYDDVSDPVMAVRELQASQRLPEQEAVNHLRDIPVVFPDDDELGDCFTFADTSEVSITSVEEAVSLLSLEELKILAKDAKVPGKNKATLSTAFCRMAHQQTGLLSLGLQPLSEIAEESGKEKESGQNRNRLDHYVRKILTLTGPCIRLSPSIFKLFERVHLVFYRSTEWTEKSLTTIILAKIAKRNYPEYVVCRSSNIFASRACLVEFECAIKLESEVDKIIEFGDPPGEVGFRRVVEIYESLHPRWTALVVEEKVKEDKVYESGEGEYLRRFSAAHSYTRILHKAAWALGRLKDYKREHGILTELLAQRLFHTARRGSWYQRRALLEEHYMYAVDTASGIPDEAMRKRHWKETAVQTCETALQDIHCHLIYHYDLQKRIVKLEKSLRIPRRLQHDFGHVSLLQPIQHIVTGIQIKKEPTVGKNGKSALGTKTVWVDEGEGGGECSVEAMCLTWYRSQGWKGYHSEGGIIRTLFAYLFFDILFLYIPNVFQTPYQACPLDLHTDSFYGARASEINRRLAEITNGSAEKIIREVDARERERRTCVVGLQWDFEVEDLVELANCMEGGALAAVCQVMAQEYRQRGGGIPDLILWRTEPSRECMFAEVKSANDRLSDTQRLWIHVLTGAGVNVALCNAVAREVRAAYGE